MFQRRHYTKFARAVRDIEWTPDREMIATFLANVFTEDNPLFSRDKFIQACENTEEER